MEASFDGIRKTLADNFNQLMYTEPPENQKVALRNLRWTIVGLLCMYNPEIEGDYNDLIDEVELIAVDPEGDDDGE